MRETKEIFEAHWVRNLVFVDALLFATPCITHACQSSCALQSCGVRVRARTHVRMRHVYEFLDLFQSLLACNVCTRAQMCVLDMHVNFIMCDFFDTRARVCVRARA